MFKRVRTLHKSEEKLVEACLKGDTRSQKLLYEQYRRQMFRMCLRYARTDQEAEDYLQDGFIKVFIDLKQYQFKGPLGAWIRKVILNVILQEIRKRKQLFPAVDINAMADQIGADERMSAELDARTLTSYIQQLPDGYRAVFNMYAVEGYSHKEIAHRLGISVGTSKSQLSKARASLRATIEILMFVPND